MKKTIVAISILLCVGIHASEADKPTKLTAEQEHDMFTAHGVPVPGTGAIVVPSKPLKGAMAKQFNANIMAMKNEGYIKQNNDHAKILMNMKALSKGDLDKNNNNPTSTHIKSSIQSVVVAYDYKGVPDSLVSERIGYVASGAYLQGSGWTGISEFFKSSNEFNKMSCSFEQSNIKITGGSAEFSEDTITYRVNGKITDETVIGNDDSGYEYHIQWWDENYRNDLTCADLKFEKDTTNKVIELAKKIDASL